MILALIHRGYSKSPHHELTDIHSADDAINDLQQAIILCEQYRSQIPRSMAYFRLGKIQWRHHKDYEAAKHSFQIAETIAKSNDEPEISEDAKYYHELMIDKLTIEYQKD